MAPITTTSEAGLRQRSNPSWTSSFTSTASQFLPRTILSPATHQPLARRALSDAASGGITVGCAIIALVLLVLGWRFHKRLRREREKKRKESNASDTTSPSMSQTNRNSIIGAAAAGQVDDVEKRLAQQRARNGDALAGARRSAHSRNGSDESLGRYYMKPDSRRSSRHLEIMYPITENEASMSQEDLSIPKTKTPSPPLAHAVPAVPAIPAAPPVPVPEILVPQEAAARPISGRFAASPLRNEVRNAT